MSGKANKDTDPNDVRVVSDKGSLRFQFSSKFSRVIFGRRQYYKGLGRKDTPQNREWALRIALNIQADFDNPDPNLLDRTLEKYLGDRLEKKKLPNERSLSEIWNDYAKFKLESGAIHQTTYQTRYQRTYKNWLNPWLDNSIDRQLVDEIAQKLIQAANYKPTLKKLLLALVEMGDRAVKLSYLSENYFDSLTNIAKHLKPGKKSHQLSEMEGYKAFSKEERDLIIASFYASNIYSERRMAELVEFLFLTGCREGEAFAFKWGDVKPGYIIFDESYSSECKLEKTTKTSTIRIFRTEGYTKLLDLLERVKPNHFSSNNYVFSINGTQLNRAYLNRAWHGRYSRKVFYPGVVKKLELDGKLVYLKPSSTRHTFISLQLRKGTDIKFLADSVGNSPSIIYQHYFGNDLNCSFID